MRELEKTLERDSGSLEPTTKLDDIGWDSFSELAFLSLVDKKIGVQIPADQVSECRTVGQLVDLLAGSLEA